MTKKIIALLLVSLMTFSLAACGGDNDSVSSNLSTQQVVSDLETVNSKEETADSSKEDDTSSLQSETQSVQQESSVVESTQSTQTQSQPVQSQVQTPSQNQTASQQTTSQNQTASQQAPSKIQTTISTPATNTTSKVTVTDNGVSIKPITDLKVTAGESISQGLDLGGKTITMAITEEGQYSTNSFKRCVAAFETAYNCKVEIKKLTFGTYSAQFAQAKAAGNVYDIGFAHGYMFPTLAFDDVFEPVGDALRSGDILTSTTSGGIDLNKTSYFVYNDKIWGTCNYNSCFPYLIYYNKKMLADAGYSGSKDPRFLAEQGKWTWQIIEKMGKELTDAKTGKYLLSASFTYGRAIPLTFGAQCVVSDGKGGYKQNITSVDYINALKYKQKLLLGANAICESDGTITFEGLTSGKVYMWCEESSKYLDLALAAPNSTALGRSKSNIGIVEMPLAGNNKDRYPTGWLTAVVCGKGKDPRVAIAWDVFRSKYVDPLEASDPNAFTPEDKKYVNNLLVGNICLDIGRFYTSDEDTGTLISTQMDYSVRKGSDITREVTSYKDKVQACIDFTCKKK